MNYSSRQAKFNIQIYLFITPWCSRITTFYPERIKSVFHRFGWYAPWMISQWTENFHFVASVVATYTVPPYSVRILENLLLLLHRILMRILKYKQEMGQSGRLWKSLRGALNISRKLRQMRLTGVILSQARITKFHCTRMHKFSGL